MDEKDNSNKPKQFDDKRTDRDKLKFFSSLEVPVDIDKIDENLLAGKNYYNKNTSELNKIIQKFPSNFVAKLHRYKIKPFFDGKNMQDTIIDDFKL